MENDKLVRMRAVQDAIDNLDWIDGGGGKIYVRQTELVDAIDSIPAVDAVEVLRCRDCKYFEIHVVNDYDIGEVELTSCAAFGIGDIHSDDYCSFGQRREE